ncbi:hypothetical protein BDR22DRAFT_801860 [Usnea florida]
MRERRDREARKKRVQDEEEQRRIREEQQLEAATAGVAETSERRRVDRGDRGSGGSAKTNIPSTSQPAVYQPSNVRVEKPTANLPDDGSGVSGVPQPRTRPRGATVSTGQPRPVEAKPRQTPRATSAAAAAASGQKENKNASVNATAGTSQLRLDRGTVPPSQSQPAQDSTSGSQQRSTTSSFPHAFERWETLSSHWEGLTSFWIHRLEQNKDDLEREPLNQQMARQVTDLSAAGANLFHAVVELQRLRASSERKFQRWFFETRAEQERFRENQSKFEQRIQEERSAATNAHADLSRIQKERDTAISQRKTAEVLVREKNRELLIAKEEARRAWEELGRREQEERDRTLSLKKGQATSVGGVHVVPMVQTGSNTRPATREGPAASSIPSRSVQLSPTDDEPGYTTYDPARSETDTDPFTEGGRVNPTQGARSEADRPLQSHTTSQPDQQTSNTSAAAESSAPDYSGSGFGAGWEALPRHHHPTRLSDVLEEDERSRATPSRASQNSRGMR